MRTRIVLSVLCLALLLTAIPAEAQYAARRSSERATGEDYHVEVGGFFWNPNPNMVIQSERFGIIGTQIDLIQDLGLPQTRFNQMKVVLRPSTRHKFRFEYTPIKYEQPEGVLQRNIVFNGILYNVALPVASMMDWRAYRFGYEFDFIYRDRGFLGILLEAKYTDVRAELRNVLNDEYIRARAPIPAIGAIGRVYVAPNISITGEFSGFKLPEGIDENYRAKYFDFDLYGTINLNDHFGGQVGYRSFDVFYKINDDEGDLKLKGLYFGAVARF